LFSSRKKPRERVKAALGEERGVIIKGCKRKRCRIDNGVEMKVCLRKKEGEQEEDEKRVRKRGWGFRVSTRQECAKSVISAKAKQT
jgi:hypothetical protein